MGNQISPVQQTQVSDMVPFQMTTEQLVNRKRGIEEIQRKVMKRDVDYGIIPGCLKPSLLKPGAETLNITFGLRPILNPETDIKETALPNNHRSYQVTVHIMSMGGLEMASGVGSCSTMETKYRFRKAEQTCPKCGKPTIIKGKKEYGGGWLCYAKKGGCSEKFKDGDPAIENQNMGRVEHDNPADYYNTCLKMAKKRGLIDGTINATAASHVFTQDVEDLPQEAIHKDVIDVTPEKEKKEPEKEAEMTNLDAPKIDGELPPGKIPAGYVWMPCEVEKGGCGKVKVINAKSRLCYSCYHKKGDDAPN